MANKEVGDGTTVGEEFQIRIFRHSTIYIYGRQAAD